MKKVLIIGACALLLACAAYYYSSSKSKSELPLEEVVGEEVREVEALHDEEVPIESKVSVDPIEKEEREIESEQKVEDKLAVENDSVKEESGSPESFMEEEKEEEKAEAKREEDKEIASTEVASASLITEARLFRRYFNGKFTGSASVKKNKKKENWEISVETDYQTEQKKLLGNCLIEISGGSSNGRYQSSGQNNNYFKSEDGSILVNVSPSTLLKINRKGRNLLRGQVFEKDKKTENFVSIGKFKLNRE